MNSQFEPGTNSNPLGRDNPNESDFPVNDTNKDKNDASNKRYGSCTSTDSLKGNDSIPQPQRTEENNNSAKETFDFNPEIMDENKDHNINSPHNSLDPSQEKYPIQQTEVIEVTATEKEVDNAVDEINPDINSMDSRG